MAVSMKEIIMIHVRASGPCSFASLLWYCREQYVGEVDDYLVAKAITELIRAGALELYDDGVTFIASEGD